MTNGISKIDGSLMTLALALILAALLFTPVYAGLLLLTAAGLLITRYRVQYIPPAEGFWRQLWADELGVVGVLYFIRGGQGVLINGSATPPTASQAQSCFKQSAQIFVADTDTQALFTHNWGLDISAPTYLEPEIFYYGQLLNAGTWLTGFTFDVTNTNVVKINKLSFANSGGTFIVTLRRPQSIGQ